MRYVCMCFCLLMYHTSPIVFLLNFPLKTQFRPQKWNGRPRKPLIWHPTSLYCFIIIKHISYRVSQNDDFEKKNFFADFLKKRSIEFLVIYIIGKAGYSTFWICNQLNWLFSKMKIFFKRSVVLMCKCLCFVLLIKLEALCVCLSEEIVC